MSDERVTQEIEYSVVVPVYESAESVRELVARLHAVFGELEATYEVVLVDDGSASPDTWPTLQELAARFPTVVAIRLTRNFGKPGAVLCGFEHARGRWVFTMDDDLQHLPEDIPKFVALRDHDVVMGAYTRKRHPLSKRLTSRVKNWFDRVLAGKPRHLVSNPFRLHKAAVVRAICRMQSPYPFISAMMYYTTRDIATVEVEHGERAGRPSQFTFRRRIRSFSNLLINRSAFLMRLVAFLGLVVCALTLVAGAGLGVAALAGWGEVTFGRILLMALLFTNGLVLFAVAVIGEYLTRILVGVERRPPYLVREVLAAERSVT